MPDKLPPDPRINQSIFSDDVRESLCASYHIWFFENSIWHDMTWCGIHTLKSPSDMWNYQEIITEMRPSVIFETGTYKGGSALFFASILQQLGLKAKLLTCDPTDWGISPMTRAHPMIEIMKKPSVSDEVKNRLKELRAEFPGPMFVILDGDHRAITVLCELHMLREILVKGDYVITEDSNVNGHPILIDYDGGRDVNKMVPGPYEALVEYERQHPGDYIHDVKREKKFGWTFATNGFLIKT